jgi:hypothetical protein
MILGHFPVNLKPFLRYLPSIVHRQYLIAIFIEKVCTILDIIQYVLGYILMAIGYTR